MSSFLLAIDVGVFLLSSVSWRSHKRMLCLICEITNADSLAIDRPDTVTREMYLRTYLGSLSIYCPE